MSFCLAHYDTKKDSYRLYKNYVSNIGSTQWLPWLTFHFYLWVYDMQVQDAPWQSNRVPTKIPSTTCEQSSQETITWCLLITISSLHRILDRINVRGDVWLRLRVENMGFHLRELHMSLATYDTRCNTHLSVASEGHDYTIHNTRYMDEACIVQ